MAGEQVTLSASNKPEQRLRWTILIAALVIVVLRIVCPAIFDRVDAISVALLVAAAIPWMSPYISKFSIVGVFEAELRKLEQQVQETQQEVATASQIAIRSHDMSLLGDRDDRDAHAVDQSRGSSKALANLGTRYVAVRDEMQSGAQRTATMDALFRTMVNKARALGPAWRDHADWLRNEDAGRQLAAIAYAYAYPEKVEIGDLLELIERTKQPFIQFWGLRAIQRALDAGEQVSPRDSRRLEDLENAVRAGTDRHFMLTTINRMVRTRLQA